MSKHLVNLQCAADTTYFALAERRVMEVGAYSYGNFHIHVWPSSEVLVIGRYCGIALGVEFILGGNHQSGWASTYPFSRFPPQWDDRPHRADVVSRGPVRVGHNVWISTNALILSGVTIGNGAIVGAGAVVTRDIPAYHMAAGNPARVVRPRFEPATIELLERIAWWDWPDECVRRHREALQSPDIGQLAAIAAAEGLLR